MTDTVTTKILTADEVAEIGRVIAADIWDSLDIGALVDSHEALRADRDAIDARRAALAETLVEIRGDAGQALEDDQQSLRSAIRAETSSTTPSPQG